MTDDVTRDELEAQEGAFVFESFDQATAWRLGNAAVDVITDRGIAVAVQIAIGDHVVFKAAVNGIDNATDAWLAGKARAAVHFDSASLLLRFRRNEDDAFLTGLDQDVYRTHGGSVPIRVAGEGTVGTITVSGAPDLTDHAIAIEALQRVILK